MSSLIRSSAVLVVFAVASCVQQPPECRVADEASDQRIGNAGCLITLNGRTLLISHAVSGKLGFPGGTAREGESAQCTAHRETWEETGPDLVVGEHVRTLSTQFHLYACGSGAPELVDGEVPDLPLRSHDEVDGMLWRDIDQIERSQWRFPDQIEEVRGLDDASEL